MPGFPILQIQHALVVQVYDQSDAPLIDCTTNYQSFVEETGLPVTSAALGFGTDFSETTAEIFREISPAEVSASDANHPQPPLQWRL